jgi:hypothetical protein
MLNDRFDIRNYSRIYNTIDTELCDKVVNELANVEFESHKWHVPVSNINKDNGNEFDVYGGNVCQHEITESIGKAVRSYMTDMQKMTGIRLELPYGFSYPRYNMMSEGHDMNFHYDHIYSAYTGDTRGIPVLTVLGLLSNNHQGGEFVMFEDNIIEMSKGDILIWPSLFMYPHGVKKVTQGTRHTFVAWGS